MAPLIKQVPKIPYAAVGKKKWRRYIEGDIAGGIAQDAIFKEGSLRQRRSPLRDKGSQETHGRETPENP